MTRKEQIDLLGNAIENDFATIESILYSSIKSRVLDTTVLIKIKNFLENLKTILDFLAKEILEKYCDKQVRNFFPILREELNDNEIKNAITGCFPGLHKNFSALFDYFLNIQPKYNANNKWLLELNDLCNSNKHEILSLQIRKDSVVNKLTFKNGWTYLWNDGLVEFGTDLSGPITLQPAGQFSWSVNPNINHQDDHLQQFGWIVEKLKDHKILSGPNLDNISNDLYTLDSYMVGNFYFPDQRINALYQLNQYKRNTKETIEKIYELLSQKNKGP